MGAGEARPHILVAIEIGKTWNVKQINRGG